MMMWFIMIVLFGQVDGMTTHWLIGKNDIDIERLQSDSVDQFNHNEKI